VFQLKAVFTFVLILVAFVLAIERASSIVRARLAT
jgi:ABC-type phosphate/phosphonate transport system permease subunit